MPLLGQISLLPFTPSPADWAPCDGSQVAIADYPALFGVIGTNFGGDGKTHFNLPDLRGRTPMGISKDYWIGSKGGVAEVTLDAATMPLHTHGLNAVTIVANNVTASGRMFAQPVDVDGNAVDVYVSEGAMVTLADDSIAPAGAGTAHDNMQPYLAMGCYIAITGAFAMRTGE